MSEEKIISKALCTQCKNFTYWEDVDVFECELGRHTEIDEAEKNNWLTECPYWEAKKGLSPYKTTYTLEEVCEKLNEQQEQLDLYKEAILTMLGLLADKGIILSGVKDE